MTLEDCLDGVEIKCPQNHSIEMEIIDSTNNKAKQKTDFVWAPYSLDFNPLDFFLWFT